MPDTTTTPPAQGTQHPTPITPADNMPVDGSAALFEWSPVPGALSYQLQIASEADFKEALYTIEAGPTTLLTLFEMLPEDGSVFYWRVQAKTQHDWQPWSEGVAFQTLSAHQVRSQKTAHTTRSATPSKTAPDTATAHIEEPLYKTGHTSLGFALFFLSTLIISFMALLVILFTLVNR